MTGGYVHPHNKSWLQSWLNAKHISFHLFQSRTWVKYNIIKFLKDIYISSDFLKIKSSKLVLMDAL